MNRPQRSPARPTAERRSSRPPSPTRTHRAVSAFSRLGPLLSQQVLRRRLPHGLIGWRYLWPGSDERVRRHRALWWASGQHWPRPIWLGVQLWLWLRWTLWQAWISCWRVVRSCGSEVASREGIPQWRQAWRVLRLALGWCIPPRDAYRFGLYRHPERALNFVYDHQVQTFHPWRSQPLGLTRASLALLQDKLALAEALTCLGVPMVESGACIPGHTRGPPLVDLMGPWDRVFCKTRSGQRGLGAFAAWRTADGLQGRTIEGSDLADAEAVEAAWARLLTIDDALIQRCLANHPGLAPLSCNEDAITVRFISEWQDASLTCRCAVLEIPTGRNKQTGQLSYTILPIEPASGRLLHWPRPDELPGPRREAMDRLWALIPDGLSIPDWSALVAGSNRSHRRFADVRAIAWDWVITPDGARLLEGNAGWGMVIPQMLHGGSLADDDK